MKSTINSQLNSTCVKNLNNLYSSFSNFSWGYGKRKIINSKSWIPIYKNCHWNETSPSSFQTQFQFLKIFAVDLLKKTRIFLVTKLRIYRKWWPLISHSTLFDRGHTCFSSTQLLIQNFNFLWGYEKGKLIYPLSWSPIYTNFSLNVREQLHLASKLNESKKTPLKFWKYLL